VAWNLEDNILILQKHQKPRPEMTKNDALSGTDRGQQLQTAQ